MKISLIISLAVQFSKCFNLNGYKRHADNANDGRHELTLNLDSMEKDVNFANGLSICGHFYLRKFRPVQLFKVGHDPLGIIVDAYDVVPIFRFGNGVFRSKSE